MSSNATEAYVAAPSKVTSRTKSVDATQQPDGGEQTGCGPNPFDDAGMAAHWQHVYEEAHYECRNYFDPTALWSRSEENRVVKKLDWHLCTWACLMFFSLQVDRGNLVQAVSDNMLNDLGLSTDDYNYGNTVFLIAFLLAELPSQLVSKKMGPDRWVPLQICLWSIVACAQCALKGRVSFLTTRALLGLLEGGFIPDMVLWLSYFYTSRELPVRISYFFTTLSATSIATSLLAFALLRMRGVLGWAGWRWLFLIEGLITLVVGFASFFYMPASAVQTKTKWNPEGWFTDREVVIAVNRILRDDPSKGDMHNRQAITSRRLWSVICDYDLWPLYLLGLTSVVPSNPPSKYITLILKSIGFDTFNSNLLTIPSSVIHIVTLLLITYLSEYLNERSLIASTQVLWTLPCVIALRWWPGIINDTWGTYALVTTLLSYPYCHAILVAWVSKNSNNVGARSVSAALYNMSTQLGTIIANFVYREDDKPYYYRGNGTLVAINIVALLLFFLTKLYYVWRNRQREKVWNAMSDEEKRTYIQDTRVKGSRRLDFRFAH